MSEDKIKFDSFIKGELIDLVVLTENIVEKTNWYNWFNDEENTIHMQNMRKAKSFLLPCVFRIFRSLLLLFLGRQLVRVSYFHRVELVGDGKRLSGESLWDYALRATASFFKMSFKCAYESYHASAMVAQKVCLCLMSIYCSPTGRVHWPAMAGGSLGICVCASTMVKSSPETDFSDI